MKALRTAVCVLLLSRLAVSVASANGLGWDFVNYHNAGNRVYHGQAADLYHATAPIDGRPPLGDGRQIYYGVPISAFVFAPLGAFEPRTALVMFKAACALCLLAALVLVYPLVRRAAGDRLTPDQTLVAYLAACLLYAPFWFIFEVGGQATALNLLLLVLFYRSYVDDAPWRAAVWVSLGILVKPVLAVGVLIFLLAQDRRFLVRLAVLFAGEGAVSLLMLGWPLHLEWLRFVLSESSRISEPWWNNSSIAGVFYTFWYGWQGEALTSPWPVTPTFQHGVLGLKLATLGLFAWLTRRVVTTGAAPDDRRHHLAVLSMLLPLLVASIAWPHYLAFLFLPIGLILVRADRLPPAGRVLAWAVLLSTLSVQSRFAQRFVIDHLADARVVQALTAGLFGGCTLLLLFGFLLGYYPWVIAAQKGLAAEAVTRSGT